MEQQKIKKENVYGGGGGELCNEWKGALALEIKAVKLKKKNADWKIEKNK